MDSPLRAPKNRTAELQLILRHVTQGYIYWVADEIPIGRINGFLNKWSRYRIQADPAARAWRKKTGKANTQLVIGHEFNRMADRKQASVSALAVPWILLGTLGKDGLMDGLPTPGVIRNAESKDGRILWAGYELVRQPKTYTTAKGRLKTETTWTWRLPSKRYREWEARIAELAKHHALGELHTTFEILSSLPMFAGIRTQVIKLHREANKLLVKAGANPLPDLNLPFVTMQRIWG